jgi:hypothetical protein
MPKFILSATTQTDLRDAKIRAFLHTFHNHDPEWDEIIETAALSDDSLLWDMVSVFDDSDAVRARLHVAFPDVIIDTSLPLWKLVDSIDQQRRPA